MDAAPRLNRRHTGAQVDPELGIALAETDRRRPRHQSRKPERRQRQFIKSRGAFEVADANGDMVDHEVLRRFLPSLRAKRSNPFCRGDSRDCFVASLLKRNKLISY